MHKKLFRTCLWIGLLLCVVAIVLFRSSGAGRPLASVRLADGRLLNIEGITYGTEHRIGSRSLIVEHFGPWLPKVITDLATPKFPRSDIQLEKPGLVVWVNALSLATGKQVDCQSIRVEFIDKHGDLFGTETSSWFGGAAFWRVGHVFHAFPRTQRELTLQITPWRSNETVQVKFPNPFVTAPAHWTGRPLPQQQRAGDLDILLTSLTARTNGGPKKYWETPSAYWEPVWDLRHGDEPATGWDAPEWTTADPSGNTGKRLGVHQPVLRFTASFYPSATNAAATVLLTNCPSTAVTNLVATNWWNITARSGSNSIEILGLFPAGMHIFSGGLYQLNPPVKMMPTQGGASSGWVSQSHRLSPTLKPTWYGHYTPSPVIYLRAAPLPSGQRLGIRLRDELGFLWTATPDSRGANDIQPFLLELPTDVTTITAEIVLLRPLQASFDVDATHIKP